MAATRVLSAACALLAGSCASKTIAVVDTSPRPVPSAVVAAPEAPKPRPMPSAPFTLRDGLDRAIEVYPPLTKQQRAPLIVFLHATCMQPASVCDWFGDAGRDQGWLVCPSGNTTCYGEPDWHGPGPEKAAFLANALATVEHEIGSFVEDRPGLLIGWSRGAFAARDILEASPSNAKSAVLPGRFRGLVLIAAHTAPSVSMLKRAGITRVVMAAGDYDGARPTMQSAVAKLQSNGLEARYVSLGKIGHAWPNDFAARMREPIAWAAGQ